MAQVSRLRTYEVSPDEMWGRIGDFHGLHTWHPAVVSSTPVAGGEGRALTLGDGAKVSETRTGEGPRSYSYRIDESPLPVQDYEATIAVRESDGGCEVSWEAQFEPAGASESEAAGIIAGIFDAGLESL